MGSFTPAEFATNMLAAATSPERVATAVAQLLGPTIEVGPIPVGPAGIGAVQAVALPGPIEATHCADPDWDVAVAVPLVVRTHVTIGVRVFAYDIDLCVRTRIRLILEPPCAVVIDVERLTSEHVTSTLDPRGLPSRVLAWVGNVGAIVDDRVITFINDMLCNQEFEALRRIDIAVLLDRVWESGVFAPPAALLVPHPVACA